MTSGCSCRRKTTGTQIKSEMETPSCYVLLLRLCPRYARCIVCCSTCTARTFRILVPVIADTHAAAAAVRKIIQLEVPKSANSTPRMSADGGLSMTATVSSDSTQLHLPWMVVCRNQHHANCQPVDAPAGTRSRVAPADDICRYRRDICDCQTEERGHWCASSSVYSERAYCSNAAHGDRRWHGRMLRDRFSDPASCLLLGKAFGDQ